MSLGLSAQCYMDRHNTNWHDAWVSCQTDMSPNTSRGLGHWIMYDLGYTYILGDIHVWNINDPDHLDRGAMQIAIDLSTDGENWVEQGTYFLAQGNGTSIYEGEDLTDFNDAEAHYVLFTILDNYGATCAGISELKIEVNGVVTSVNESVDPEACFDLQVFPNPHVDEFYTRISSTCPEMIYIKIYDALGRIIEERSMNPQEDGGLITIQSKNMEAGIYTMSIQQGEAIGRYQVLKSR